MILRTKTETDSRRRDPPEASHGRPGREPQTTGPSTPRLGKAHHRPAATSAGGGGAVAEADFGVRRRRVTRKQMRRNAESGLTPPGPRPAREGGRRLRMAGGLFGFFG